MSKTSKNNKVLVIGAGLSGCSISYLFKNAGFNVEIVEKEKKIGGLAKDNYQNGFYVNKSGAHIFHTDNKEVISFVSKFTKLNEYKHKVLCVNDFGLTYWQPNKSSISLNKFLNPSRKIEEDFIIPYSIKQWGKHYKEVIKNVKKRYKFKDNINSDYFQGEFQGIPDKGYSNMMNEMLKGVKKIMSKAITIKNLKLNEYKYIIVTASLDEFFLNRFGKLDFITLDFKFKEIEHEGNILPTAVINLPKHPKITKIVEYNQFYFNKSKKRVIGTESPRLAKKGDLKIYPVLTRENESKLRKYKDYARKFNNLFLLGRFAEYEYYDMDDTVLRSINLFKEIIKNE
jgi:UDP-galactopyranose mutase